LPEWLKWQRIYLLTMCEALSSNLTVTKKKEKKKKRKPTQNMKNYSAYLYLQIPLQQHSFYLDRKTPLSLLKRCPRRHRFY
jgi:hypothetical protein